MGLGVALDVGVGLSEAVLVVEGVRERVGVLVGVCVCEGLADGEGVAEGAVKHVLEPGSQTAYCAEQVQKVWPAEELLPGPQGVHAMFGETRPFEKVPAPQKH